MLFLFTGKPGSFKTAKAATKALEYLKEGRPVYTNIDGFDYEGVNPLPEDQDWRNTPDGSVVIYDEAQQFDFFKYKGREKLSTDGRVQELETHRHTGHDIILITQSPNFLHNHLLGLVGSHYHLHRAYGRGFADVFLWRYAVMMPDSTGSKNKAESHEKFKPDSKIFDKYKSTTIDTHKLKIPTLNYKLGGFLLFVVTIILYMVFGSDNPFLSASKIKENADIASGKKQQNTVLDSQASAITTDQPQNIDQLNFECRKAVNVEKPECVQWFNNLSNSKGSVSGDRFENTQVSYNPNKPFDQAHIHQVVSYEVTAKPIFSGCMKKGSKYVAYTQQGTILNEVSQSDCERLIKNNDRPFNYFASNQDKAFNDVQPNNQNDTSNPIQQTVKPYIPQKEEIANNYVEPHLQAKVTNGANDQAGFNNAFR
jgi:hypothetical protein